VAWALAAAARCPAEGRVPVEVWVTVALPEELQVALLVARAADTANRRSHF